MFSIDRVCDVTLLVHLQPLSSHRKLPKAIRAIFRAAFMHVRRPIFNLHSSEFLALSRWRSTDIISNIPVKHFLSAIFKLERFIFMTMEGSLPFHERYLIETCYRLSESSRANLLVSRSYVSGLLSGSKTEDNDLFSGSVSSKDPTYVSDLVAYIKDMLSFSKLRGGNPEWFLRPNVHGSTGSFLGLFISCWEEFVSNPEILFDDNSTKSQTILQILSPNISNEKRYFSLQCVVFLFSSFLLKFFSKHSASSNLRKDVMGRFSSCIISSLSIFFHTDLIVQCFLNLMYMNGCIIDAIHSRAWIENTPPIIVRKIKIGDGTIICCCPLIEEWKFFSFAIEDLSISDYLQFIGGLYNERGRTNKFNPVNRNLEIGGIGGFEIWQVWHGAISSFFYSNFIGKTDLIHNVPSLYKLSLCSILDHIFKHKLERKNASLFADGISLSASDNKLKQYCLRARCENFFARSYYIDTCQKELSAKDFIFEQLELFLTMPEINIVSCGNEVDAHRKVLKTIFRILPFCTKSFFEFIQCYAVCESILSNLFDIRGSYSLEQEVIISAGSFAYGEFLWKFIFNTIQENELNSRLNESKPIFLRHITSLYLLYFL